MSTPFLRRITARLSRKREFDHAGVERVLFRPRDGFGVRFDRSQIDDLAFGLGDDFVLHDQDVAGLKRRRRRRRDSRSLSASESPGRISPASGIGIRRSLARSRSYVSFAATRLPTCSWRILSPRELWPSIFGEVSSFCASYLLSAGFRRGATCSCCRSGGIVDVHRNSRQIQNDARLSGGVAAA